MENPTLQRYLQSFGAADTTKPTETVPPPVDDKQIQTPAVVTTEAVEPVEPVYLGTLLAQHFGVDQNLLIDPTAKKYKYANEQGEETTESLNQIIKDIILPTVEKRTHDGLFGSFDPQSLEFIQYLRNGGKPESYFKAITTPDIPEVIAPDTDLVDVKAITKTLLTGKGLDAATVDAIIAVKETQQKLVDYANDLTKEFHATSKERKKQLVEQQQLAYQTQVKQLLEEDSKLAGSIKEKGQIKGLSVTIPEMQRSEVAGYFSMRNPKTMQTPAEEFMYNLPDDVWYQIALMFGYYKGDVKTLVTQKANDDQVRKIQMPTAKGKTTATNQTDYRSRFIANSK